MQSRNDTTYLQAPYTHVMAGSSNGGTTWTLIKTATQATTSAAQTFTFTVTGNSTAYNLYRFIATSINPGASTSGGLTDFSQLRLFGY